MARSLGMAVLSLIVVFAHLPSAAHAGAVAGRIVLAPASATASATAAALSAPGLLPGSVVEEAGRPAGPILVYVAESEAQLPRTPTPDVRMRMAGGKLTPSLVAVSLGSAITFENADRRQHRMRCRTENLRFDLGPQPRGASRVLRAEQTGIIRFKCAMHGDLHGEIVVLAHAAFAIVDPAGDYDLGELPPGRATIVAYAPQLGEVSREVVVPAAEPLEVEFAF